MKVTKTCEICSLAFCTVKQVQVHKRSLHLAFKCPSCQKCFRDEYDLQRHVKGSTLENGGPKHECGSCESKFCTQQDLQLHNETHEKKPIQCQFCSTTFTTKWRLNTHILNRSEHCCEECVVNFCNVHDLKKHVGSVHNRRNFVTLSIASRIISGICIANIKNWCNTSLYLREIKSINILKCFFYRFGSCIFKSIILPRIVVKVKLI